MLELTFPLAVLGGAVCGMRLRIAPFAACVIAISAIAAGVRLAIGLDISVLDFVFTAVALQIGYVLALVCQARFAAEEQMQPETQTVATDTAFVDRRPA